MALTQTEALVISGANMFLLLLFALLRSAKMQDEYYDRLQEETQSQEQHYIKCSTNKKGE